ncbi:cobalt-precorrin-6A reductase [Nostoc sp. LEGE 06077]|uniref:cobalt-precorrin-6A reductase n=1 Tax=Nostoc sp. LEGE 06077 TaxID=915325 RepID=UPI001882B9A7|nr:cobalt-precorrin-6A reductase [Nostoc sp. LEGE 06077]MBE9206444.1 cobalt-precorrin-6A reductase [Nostoc sp. LEGE 06077]
MLSTNYKRVLILGGTGEAAELSARIATIDGIEAIASFAGRTREPLLPSGEVRIGGFGGVEGLVEYLRQMKIDILIDATHPFANQISYNAAAAAKEVEIPRLMLIRPAWEKVTGDRWIEVESNSAAADILKNQAKRVFLTVGRQELSTFAHLQDIWFLMRMIDPPGKDALVPPGMILCDRGPFVLENERQILIQHNIDTIVSKNSGGDATYAKIIAARELGVQVVMVKRPDIPAGEKVPDVDSAVAWLQNKLHS